MGDCPQFMPTLYHQTLKIAISNKNLFFHSQFTFSKVGLAFSKVEFPLFGGDVGVESRREMRNFNLSSEESLEM